MKRRLFLALLLLAPALVSAQVQCVGNDCGAIVKTTVIAPAQVATLFTAPVVVVPAVPGKIILIDRFRVEKEAGTAWTTTGSGQLAIRFTASPNTNEVLMFNQALTSQFFDSTHRVWSGRGGKGQFAALGNVSGADANGTIGAGLELKLVTANISGGTGNVIVTVWYDLMDGF